MSAIIYTSSVKDVADSNKTNISSHLEDTNNPHEVTKSQIGLDKVENFKAVSTETSQSLTDEEKANARKNIDIVEEKVFATRAAYNEWAASEDYDANANCYIEEGSAGGALVDTAPEVSIGSEAPDPEDGYKIWVDTSHDAINTGDVVLARYDEYSTTEICIGKWTNGKPIYRIAGTLPSTAELTIKTFTVGTTTVYEYTKTTDAENSFDLSMLDAVVNATEEATDTEVEEVFG